MLWYDDANNILKMRSEADDAWINVGYLDQSANAFRILDDTQVVNTSGTQTGLLGGQTEATWIQGTSTTEGLVSPAKIKAAVEANSDQIAFDSGWISTWPQPYNVAHGLGSAPTRWIVIVRCHTAFSGFDVGDTINPPHYMDGDGSRRTIMYADTSNVVIQEMPRGQTPNNQLFSPSDSNFDLRIIAWSD
jgi:hypothetical protein